MDGSVRKAYLFLRVGHVDICVKRLNAIYPQKMWGEFQDEPKLTFIGELNTAECDGIGKL